MPKINKSNSVESKDRHRINLEQHLEVENKVQKQDRMDNSEVLWVQGIQLLNLRISSCLTEQDQSKSKIDFKQVLIAKKITNLIMNFPTQVIILRISLILVDTLLLVEILVYQEQEKVKILNLMIQ
jgi:hypothetical protein